MSRKKEEQAEDPKEKIYTVNEIKLAAYNWAELPPMNIPLHDRFLWLALANVYKRFRDKELTKEHGEQLKADIMAAYNRDKAQADLQCKIIQARAKMWGQIEVAGNRYGTERTLEAADEFYKAVYGLKPKQADQAEQSEQNENE